MASPELWAEHAVEIAGQKKLQLVILGGANDDFGDAAELALALHQGGERFMHTNHLQCLPRALYIIAIRDARYAEYEFAPGSAVIDPFGVVGECRGVVVYHLAQPEADKDQLALDI